MTNGSLLFALHFLGCCFDPWLQLDAALQRIAQLEAEVHILEKVPQDTTPLCPQRRKCISAASLDSLGSVLLLLPLQRCITCCIDTVTLSYVAATYPSSAVAAGGVSELCGRG